MDKEQTDEERTARILSKVANSIYVKIQTTKDLPGRKKNGRMP